MGYGDNRDDGDRWRGQSEGNWRGGRDEHGRGHGHGDRGFFERAGEQMRSWFGDDDRGGSGGRGDWRGGERGSREQGWSGGGDESWGRDQGWGRSERWSGDDSFGGGWGNQAPRSGGGMGGGWGRRDRSDEQSRKSGGRDEGWFGGSRSNWSGGGEDRERGQQGGGGPWGLFGGGGSRSGVHHDPHYSEWRRRQIEQLDRDYDEYRREHQSRFEQEFHGWREKRQGQRQSMDRVAEQMEVIGSDGQHIGKVDKVSGERIILAGNDPQSGGIHHSVPCSWIERVDSQVHVNRTAEQAMREWQDEERSRGQDGERSRALFERDNRGAGPHMLNRSFSGTYSDRNEER